MKIYIREGIRQQPPAMRQCCQNTQAACTRQGIPAPEISEDRAEPFPKGTGTDREHGTRPTRMTGQRCTQTLVGRGSAP